MLNGYHGAQTLSNSQLFPAYTGGVNTSATRWLSEAEQQTWRSYVSSCHAFFAAIDAQLQRDAGMPLAYYEILVQLSEAPDRALRMSELAEQTRSSRSRLSHAVSRLEERGWVRRVDCPTDKRGQVAVLTDEGMDVMRAAAPGHVAAVRKYLIDRLTPEQLKVLGEIGDLMLASTSECTLPSRPA